MFPFHMHVCVSLSGSFIFTNIAWEPYTPMFCQHMDLQTAWLRCYMVTFLTVVSNTFMLRHSMDFKITCMCCSVVAFIAFVFSKIFCFLFISYFHFSRLD